MNLDFLKYLSYTDRKINRLEVRGPSYLSKVLKTMTDIQFNPNDGVNTEVILEHFSTTPLAQEPNYLVVWYAEEGDVIIDSRWFIMDYKRTRAGQWKVSLRRDLVAEYWNDIKNEPCFIQKGFVRYNNPLIFNDEGISFNQIKTDEMLLKDATGIPWLVAYVAQWKGDTPSDTAPPDPVNLRGYAPGRSREADIELDVPFAQWKYHDYFSTQYPTEWALSEYIDRLKVGYLAEYVNCYVNIRTDNSWASYLPNEVENRPDLAVNDYLNDLADRLNDSCAYVDVVANKRACFSNVVLNTDLADLLAVNDKIIKDSDNKYYRMRFTFKEYSNGLYTVPTNNQMFTVINGFLNSEISANHLYTLQSGQSKYRVQLAGTVARYESYCEDVTAQMQNGSLTALLYDTSNHYNTEDAPYNIICMPYADGFVRTGFSDYTKINKDDAMSVMSFLAQDSNVYDIQLLPYCPFTDFEGSSSSGYTLYVPETYQLQSDYSWVYATNNQGVALQATQIIFNVRSSSFNFKVNAQRFAEDIETSSRFRKAKALTEFMRLCSPNYSGVFQFNAQKNDGLRYFEVNCTYKPFSPYIHINPNFGGLYGGDYNDNRGLICQGDFSLPIVKDAWRQYQLQNKNFQNLFNRQVEHMEKEYDIQNTLSIANLVGGAIGGAGTGAATGLFLGGGPVGAVVGGAFGGVLSAGGGIADLHYQKQLQQENLSYTKDTFNMQLDNIKALPNSLTRVGSYDIDNKVFPFVEFYQSTAEEQQALINKVEYTGMTVGVVDKLENYLEPNAEYTFVQGQLIFSNSNTTFDTHTANELYQEINKGVRIHQ